MQRGRKRALFSMADTGTSRGLYCQALEGVRNPLRAAIFNYSTGIVPRMEIEERNR